MSNCGTLGGELEQQVALTSTALSSIASAEESASARQRFSRAVLAFLGPYEAVRHFAERVVDSELFDVELVESLHSRLLPLERMADETLGAARQRGYFDDPDAAAPLLALEECNEQVKDCMVALESMLDPHLDDMMADALEKHHRGETVPLNSITK
jgi:hypothetical protein